MDQVSDITIEILRSIRDEISALRTDTNARFEQMDKRFEQMDKRFEQMDKRFERIESDIRAIASHFDRDILIMANKVGELEGKLEAHLSGHP